MDKHQIYVISGMGLDERLFFQMDFHSPNVHFINWIEPLKKESIEDYARRMMRQIHHEGNLILIGCSFGGIMSIEIAKLMRVQQIILISSIKERSELPWFFKVAQYLPIYQVSTARIRKYFRTMWGKYFGLINQEAFDFFDDMFEKHSEAYKAWSIKKMATWQNDSYPENLVHIHGTKDLVFPARKIKNAIMIPGGTHGMVVTEAQAVSRLVNDVLGS